ncbi:MAG: hypothetical protein EBV06_07510 [Planctomycetia bacterium]|nr:hypothetical protein [Planctomycetia bacterium]
MIALLLAFAVAPPSAVSLAASRGLDRLQTGAIQYTQNRQCFACHHQALSLSVARLGAAQGFAIRPGFVADQIAFTRATFETKLDRVRKGEGVPGGNTMTAYALFALSQAGHPGDEVTAALVEYLLVKQAADGSWPAVMPRPPSEGSRFTNAALALAGLSRYGDQTKVSAARAKGMAWLRKAKPVDHEDRVFRLMALSDLGDDTTEARNDLARRQNDDGSWSQLDHQPGDAYATATALVALRQAGKKGAQLQAGIDYLLRTQLSSGAWLVTTRSRPVQTFFDNGDPGGKSQFISFLATGWAVRALLESMP